MIVIGHQTALRDWLCERVQCNPTPDMACIGSVTADGTRLRGVVAFDQFNGASCFMHMAGEPGWIDKTMLHAAFDYPFNHLVCTQVLAFVDASNKTSLRICKRLGFVVMAELPEAAEDGAVFLLRLWRDNCKWLAPRRVH